MLHRLRFASLIFATLAGVMTGEAQRPVPRAEPVSPPPAGNGFTGNPTYSAVERADRSSVPIDPNKRLNVGDALSVEILEDREAPLPRQVSPTGDIDVPPLGRVRVAGKTTTEAEADIKRKLEVDYYHTASVRVSIDRVNPTAALRKVQVTGEVRAPGPIESPVSEPLYLTEAIARAGGFTQWSVRDKVVVFRPKKGGGSTTHNVKDIINNGKESEDPLLEDGDRVLVKKKWLNVTTN